MRTEPGTERHGLTRATHWHEWGNCLHSKDKTLTGYIAHYQIDKQRILFPLYQQAGGWFTLTVHESHKYRPIFVHACYDLSVWSPHNPTQRIRTAHESLRQRSWHYVMTYYQSLKTAIDTSILLRTAVEWLKYEVCQQIGEGANNFHILLCLVS